MNYDVNRRIAEYDALARWPAASGVRGRLIEATPKLFVLLADLAEISKIDSLAENEDQKCDPDVRMAVTQAALDLTSLLESYLVEEEAA